MSFARMQKEYQQLSQHIQQRNKEFELTDYQFQQAYWPIRDTSLQIIKISESYLTRKLVFYSWQLNKGVVVRRILIPQSYQVTLLPMASKPSVTSTNPALLYQQSIETPQLPPSEDENEFLTIVRHLTEIKVALAKWKVLELNPELTMHPVEQIMVESELLTIVQHKGFCSLEDIIVERAKTKQSPSLREVCHVAYQLSKYLTLFEFKRDFHLNFSAANLILSSKPTTDLLDVRLNDFGVRPLYLRLYLEMVQRHATPKQPASKAKKYAMLNDDETESPRVSKSKSELALQQLFEKELLNKALINELIKHKVSEDLEETIKSLLLFFDRLVAVITVLRLIRLIPQDEFNKVVESWFETPSQRAIIDLRFVQMRLTQLINANANFFHKLLVQSDHADQQKQFQLFIQSIKILLGPPDFVIADQLNRENAKKNDPKRVSVKNIRVAYQTLMFFHDNTDQFNFIHAPEERQKVSTVTFLQQAVTEQKVNATQQKVFQPEEVEYYLYFTNKFAGAQAVLEKTEFSELKRMFAHLYKKQSFNTYEQHVFDVQNDDDMSALLKYMKQDQGPRPVKVLIQRQQFGPSKKLVVFRMNPGTLAFLHGNKQQRKAVLGFAVQVYAELDIYNLNDSTLWLQHLRETERPLNIKFNNIHKIGEQMGIKLTSQLIGFTTLKKLDLRFADSMVTDRWVLETLIAIFWGLPALGECSLHTSGNNFARRNDPDWELKLQLTTLSKPYLDRINIAEPSPLKTLVLSLPDNAISDQMVILLAQYLKPLVQIENLTLNLSGNEISDVGMQFMLGELAALHLQSFRLKLNGMTTLTYHVLREVQKFVTGRLADMKTLEVEVQGVKVGSRGTDYIVEGLTSVECTRTVTNKECHDEEYEEEVEEQEEYEVQTEIVEEVPEPPKYIDYDQPIELSLDDDEPIRFKRIDDYEYEAPPQEAPQKRYMKQLMQRTVRRLITKLRRVEQLVETPITERVQPRLEQLTLNLAQCGLGDDGVNRLGAAISGIDQLSLVNLNLEKNQITHVGSNQLFTHLGNLSSVQSISLNLKTNNIGETGMERFGKLRCSDFLKHLALNLYNNQLGTKGAAVLGLSISKLPALNDIYLDLGMNAIADGYYILFGTILSTSMVMERFTLDLTLNPLDKEPSPEKIEWPLRNLAKKSRVQSVQLVLQQVPGITEDFVLLTAAILGSLSNLRQLSLNYNKSATGTQLKGLESIALCMTELQQLVELNLHLQKTRVTDQEIEILSIQVVRLQSLQKLHLNLQENDLKNTMPVLAAKVGQLQQLIYLKIDLSRNPNLDIECCHQFIDNLSTTQSLECLDLQMREVNITDDQIIQMGRVLKGVESLLVLNLDFSKNNLKERGAAQIGASLNQMPNLKALTLDLGLRQANIIYDASPQYRELMGRLVFYRFM